jgi:excisionase family DNA binding protein
MMTTETTSSGDDLLTYDEIAARLHVKKTVVRKWVERRQIPHLRIGNRTVRFRVAEIEAWLAASAVPPESAG